MKLNNIILKLMLCLVLSVGSCFDLKKYEQFEIKKVPSIKREDLPNEFGENAFDTVDEFIKKTAYLSHECVIYFDYITGEILKCAIGELDEVILKFEDNEFDGYHVASIHNHPSSVFSPPSARNFGILMRSFEDFELIASNKELWIFKSKYVNEKLMLELNVASVQLFKSAWEQANTFNVDEKLIDDICDSLYGIYISKYINDKNLKDIQLYKRKYSI